MADIGDGHRRPSDPIGSLVEAITDYAIFKLDRDGYVLTCNAGAERITGYARDQIVGRHFSVLYQAPTDGRAQVEMATALAKGRYADEGWRVRRDGSRFWATVALTPLFSDGGRLAGFAKVIRDDTARLEAAAERRRADAALVREQVANDLHHAVIGRLFEVGLTLDAARSAARDAPEARARIDVATDALDETIRHIRTTLWTAALAPDEDDSQPAVGDGSAGADGLRVLVVDDDEDMRVLFSTVLSELGEVHAVADAYQALAWIEHNRPDVLVLDVLLPGASGVDLLERIQGQGLDMPAVIVSGVDGGSLHQRALDSGATVMLSKPFDKRLLLASVADAARRAAQR